MVFRRGRRRAAHHPPAEVLDHQPAASASGAGAEPAENAHSRDDLADQVRAFQQEAMLAARVAETPAADLSTPGANPRVLAHRLARSDEVHRAHIDADAECALQDAELKKRRQQRQITEEDQHARSSAERTDRAFKQAVRDADEADRDVRAISEALNATHPATAATRLARAQGKILAAFLGFGAAGSALSALGIGHTVYASTSADLAAAVTAAAIIEIPSTALASFVIWTQGLLHRNTRGRVTSTEEDGTQVVVDPLSQVSERVRKGPWHAVKGLLAVSILVNLWGVLWVGIGLWGVLGAVGAVIAAVASLLGWGYSIQSSVVITANMETSGVGAALDERRRVASGAHIPTGPADHSAPLPVEVDTTQAVQYLGTAEINALFAHITGGGDQEGPDGGTPALGGPHGPTPGGDNPARFDQQEHAAEAGVTAHSGVRHDQEESPNPRGAATSGGSVPSEQGEHRNHPAVAKAIQARSQRTAERRSQVLTLWERGLCSGEIALELTRDPRTVTKALLESGVTEAAMAVRVRERMLALIEQEGPQLQNRALARRLGISRTATKNHREALRHAGHDVMDDDTDR